LKIEIAINVQPVIILSEAITLLFPQPVSANALGEPFCLRCASALRDKMAEPANLAPAVAALKRNERRSLEYGVSWRPSCLSTVPPFLHLSRPTFPIRLKNPSAGQIGSAGVEARWR
jgi:hypothetical protein